MKRFLAIALAMIMCLSLCACSVEKNDAGFITNLTSALEARWKISNSASNATTSSAYREYLTKCVDAELSKLGSYSDYIFEDENLASLAEQYYAALESQREGIQYYDVDYEMYEDLFTSKGYNERAEIIYLLAKEYSLQVSKNNTSTLNDFIAVGEKVHAIEEILTQDLLLECTGNDYELVIENSTKYDLSGAQLGFTLYDEAGIAIHTTSTYIEKWTPGAKTKASVYTNNLDFSSVEMNITLYSASINTDYIPLEYVNNMIIDIESPELPKELSYGYSGKANSKAIVNSFDFEVGYWSDGKASVELFFAGTKTYDKEGEDVSNYTCFTYKLYDEDNVVVSSGTVYVDDLAVGESFKNVSTYSDQLEPGTYRLVLEDDMY